MKRPVLRPGKSFRNLLPEIQDPVKKFFTATKEPKKDLEKQKHKTVKLINQRTTSMRIKPQEVDVTLDKALGLLNTEDVRNKKKKWNKMKNEKKKKNENENNYKNNFSFYFVMNWQ